MTDPITELSLLPDVNEFQTHMRSLVAHSFINYRANLLQLLQKNGVVMPANAKDNEILTAVYVCIAKSKSFRDDLRMFLTNMAITNLDIQPGGNNASFTGKTRAKVFPMNERKSFVGDDQEVQPHGWYGDNAIENGQEPMFTDMNIPVKTLGGVQVTAPQKKKFKETAVGGFLSGLFSQENINKAVGVGIDLLGQKMSSKATQAEIDKATQLEVEKTKALIEQQKRDQERKKWLVPVVIIGSLAVISVVAYMIYKSRQK